MSVNFITLIVILSPITFLITAFISWFQPGIRPQVVKHLALASSLVGILTAAISSFLVFQFGLLESAFIGFNEFGISLRLDVLSVIMFSMIAIIAFIVIKFSFNYLDGDSRQGKFIGGLATTIAFVQVLVLSGNLGGLLLSWILTSISLRRLLTFYPERQGAIVAAKKKTVVVRIGDAFLISAIVILYSQFGTGNLEIIFQEIKTSLAAGIFPSSLEYASIFLALAALLKSAQFPTHGWLIEVMETPTPVSALLHAGLLNAGPFLLIRMSYVMEASTFAPILIIVIAGFTALFASLAFLTQTSIKTALGYSSVAHMGFSLMVCALGAYPAALLHLVAHSFYKAHSFLTTGSVIDVIRASKVKKALRTGNPLRIALSIVLAFGVYLGFASIFGVNLKEDLALLSIGAIIVMGLSTLFSSALDSNGSLALVLRAILLAFLVSAAFFTLESGTHHLLSSQLPVVMEMNFVEIILISVILFAFGTVTFIQILAPTLSSKPLYRAFAVHLKNGFYANAIFDQVVGAFRITANEKQLHLLYKIKRDSSVHGNGNQETQSKESLKTSSIMQTKDAS